MALPASGSLALSQIQTEFGGSNPISLSEYYRGGGLTTANNSSVPASGAISIGNFRGAAKVVPGSSDYGSVGTYSWTCPAYTSLTAYTWGGGGGGAASNTFSNISYTGGNSVFYAPGVTLIGYGGTGGGNIYNPSYGTGGGASGGDANYTGGSAVQSFNGGAGASGGAGGVGAAAGGGWPGGGGGADPNGTGYGGGGGGLAVKTWAVGASGAPVPGNTYTVVVAGGGQASSAGGYWGGGPGGNGRVYLTWS